MKKVLFATVLALSALPLVSQASTEISRSHQCELMRVGTISAGGGTINELTEHLASQAQLSGADFFRVTHLSTDKLGYATATLYDNAEGNS